MLQLCLLQCAAVAQLQDFVFITLHQQWALISSFPASLSSGSIYKTRSCLAESHTGPHPNNKQECTHSICAHTRCAGIHSSLNPLCHVSTVLLLLSIHQTCFCCRTSVLSFKTLLRKLKTIVHCWNKAGLDIIMTKNKCASRACRVVEREACLKDSKYTLARIVSTLLFANSLF